MHIRLRVASRCGGRSDRYGRVNGPKASDEHLTIDWVFTDVGHTHRTELTNGVLIQGVDPDRGGAELTVTLTKPELLAVLGGHGLDGIDTAG